MGRKDNMTALVRLRRDYIRLKNDPVPFISAEPLPSNILEWHYVVRGPDGSPYDGGIYHGMLRFPVEYPFQPPSIYMITPSGRFKPNTRLCLSISDFHPDTWNPGWSVSTILTGLLSFMLETAPTAGSIETSEYEKRLLARHSLQYNLADSVFCELFPDIAQEVSQRLAEIRRQEEESSAAGGASTVVGRLRADRLLNSGIGQGGGLISNLVILAAVVAFAAIVHYVLGSVT